MYNLVLTMQNENGKSTINERKNDSKNSAHVYLIINNSYELLTYTTRIYPYIRKEGFNRLMPYIREKLNNVALLKLRMEEVL